jgi:AraC-like DNA-binding protein
VKELAEYQKVMVEDLAVMAVKAVRNIQKAMTEKALLKAENRRDEVMAIAQMNGLTDEVVFRSRQILANR